MRILSWFPLIYFLLELYVLVSVGSEIGALAVVLWVIVAAVLGIFFIRNAGVATVMAVRERMARGESPDGEMMTGVYWFLAGVLLIIPGFISDFVAFILLVPFARRWIGRLFIAGRVRQTRTYQQQSSAEPKYESRQAHTIIEGEYQRHDEPEKK